MLVPLFAVAIVVALVTAPHDLGLVLAAAAMTLMMAITLDWLARGLEKMGAAALATAAGGVTVLAGVVLVAVASGGATAAMSVFAAGEAVVALICWWTTRSEGRPEVGFRGVMPMVRHAWPLAVFALIFYSYQANLDTIILAITRSADEAGLYSAAYRIYLSLTVVVMFAAFATLPALARGSAAGQSAEAGAILRRTLTEMALYGIAVLGIVELVGEAALGVMFGSEFESMGAVLIVLCIGLGWYAIGLPAGYSMLAVHRNRALLAGAATAGGLNVALNLALIPVFGAIGAAIATAGAFVAAALVWLGRANVLTWARSPLLLSLTLVSAGAVIAAALPETRVPIGVATLAVCIPVFRGRSESSPTHPGAGDGPSASLATR